MRPSRSTWVVSVAATPAAVRRSAARTVVATPAVRAPVAVAEPRTCAVAARRWSTGWSSPVAVAVAVHVRTCARSRTAVTAAATRRVPGVDQRCDGRRARRHGCRRRRWCCRIDGRRRPERIGGHGWRGRHVDGVLRRGRRRRRLVRRRRWRRIDDVLRRRRRRVGPRRRRRRIGDLRERLQVRRRARGAELGRTGTDHDHDGTHDHRRRPRPPRSRHRQHRPRPTATEAPRSTVSAGGSVEIASSGWSPGGEVTATLHSDPVVLGAVLTSATARS